MKGTTRAILYSAAYTIWIAVFRLLIITLITYFLMASQSRFQEISDAYGANELIIMGFSALLFVFTLRILNPLTRTATDEIITVHRFEKRFTPGFLRGVILASGITAAFLVSGHYRYWGFFIQPEEAPMAIAGVVIRILALTCLAYCEEFIFRNRIFNNLRKDVPDVYAIIITSVVFCGIKALQFELGIMHLITLFLISIAVSLRTIIDGDFARGAGFWAGLLVVFHPLLSLPIFGNEFQGVMLVKYQTTGFSLLSGGFSGPLSCLVLQLFLAIDIAQSAIKNKKILLNTSAQR
jgi:membrane protease YdiL (CAAX protease family)